MNGSVLERPAERSRVADETAVNPSPPFAQAAAGLRRIARFHAEEPTVAFLNALRAAPLRAESGLHLDRDDAAQAIALLDEMVSDLPDPITEESVDPLRADHTAIYQTDVYRACPTESAWMMEDGQPPPDLGATLRRWRQHAGVAADPALTADHLVSEILLLANLLDNGQAADATLFLDQHPLRWIPPFCSRVATRCREPFYAGVAILTTAHLDHLRDLLGAACGLPRPPDDDNADTRRRRWAEGRLPRTCGCDA